VVATEHVGVDK
jgi:16S rRNA G1207 methylase RsmC